MWERKENHNLSMQALNSQNEFAKMCDKSYLGKIESLQSSYVRFVSELLYFLT